MRFVLEVECDNAAFGDNPKEEVGAILYRLADRLLSEREAAPDSGALRDTNGNSVGTWAVDR